MEFQILSSDELYNLLKGKEPFLHKDIIENYKYLSFQFNFIKQDSFVVALSENKDVMGILEYGPSGVDKDLYWMRFVTVHPDHRNKGVAKGLLTACFDAVSKIDNSRLELSTYEQEGEVLIDTVCELAKNYDMQIKHKLWNTDYQDAKKDFIRKGDRVLVEDSDYSGEGVVKSFYDSYGSRIELTLDNETSVNIKTSSVLHKIK